MEIQFPLTEIDQNAQKTAEHWFDHYSVEINKVGKDKIPLINKNAVHKNELVRFRGIISNQLNSEYFNKLSKFRNAADFKQPNDYQPNNKDIMQRLPMIIRTAPNQTKWSQSIIFGDDNEAPKNNTIMAKFYCHSKSLKICDDIEVFGIWAPKIRVLEPCTDEEKQNQDNNQEKNKENSDQKVIYFHTSSHIFINECMINLGRTYSAKECIR